MQYINPSVEYWQQGDDLAAHVARCARVCYKSERTNHNDEMVGRLADSGHLSMFRHESRYFIIRDTRAIKKGKWVLHYLQNSDYCSIYVMKKTRTAYISTNGQFIRDHDSLFHHFLVNNEVSESEFIREAVTTGAKAVQLLVRHTVCLVTEIATSRELNRTSPNAIAEQSTRYVSFGRKGGITISRPWWMLENALPKPKHGFLTSIIMRASWHVCDIAYRLLAWLGVKPQEARAVLPMETATRVVYTYNGFEWHHIFDLRLRQTTGKAHPDAIVAAALIRQAIMEKMKIYGLNEVEL